MRGAEISLDPVVSQLSVPTGQSTGASAAAAPVVRRGVRDGHVILYIVLALLALVPGLVGWIYGPVGEGTVVGAWHARLLWVLEDIKFGSGLRFWFGVVGATMMALLLLYPLRKALAHRFRVGAVGGWFHIHIVFGVFGPVLVLYHCNFGWGGFNANVALIAMLIVAISGIVGQFVYAHASAGFYGEKQQVRALLDSTLQQLRALDMMSEDMTALIARLAQFEEELLAPRRGLFARIRGSLNIEVRRVQVFHEAAQILADLDRERRWSPALHEERRQIVRRYLTAFFATARRAASRSVTEQLWARWRMFHLPVFVIMVVAAVLHVVAVWDMDGPEPQAAAAIETATEVRQARPPSPANGVAQKAVRTEPVTLPSQSAETRAAITTADKTSAIGALLAAQAVGPPRPATVSPRKPRPEVVQQPQLVAQQALLPDPATAQPLLQSQLKPAVRQPTPVAASVSETAAPVEEPRPAPRPASQTARSPAPAEAPPEAAKAVRDNQPSVFAEMKARPDSPSAAPPPVIAKAAQRGLARPIAQPVKDEGADAVAELGRRLDGQPMGLGLKGRTLTEQLAELKAARFDHNKTHFPLTGKHVKVACESCHTKTLVGTPTTCIACHRKDDVHRGRRPDCARCHVTSTWRPSRR